MIGFFLCSDGVHAFLPAEAIAETLRERSASEDTRRALWLPLRWNLGSTDNCTALVVDVVELPTAELADIGAAIMQLPLIPVPIDGETVDGFVLKVLMSDGRYTRLFGAMDESRRRRSGAEISQATGRGRGYLPRRLRPRGLGWCAGAQPVGWPYD